MLCSLVPRWERTPPASALQAATDWLVLDAAARCAWAEAEWLADGLTTSVATAIHAVAQARPALPALEQALRRARATPSVDPLVAGALAAAVAATRQRLVTVVPRARAQTPLAKAVALHMAVVGRPPEAVSGRLLERLARSWDAVFADPATAEALAARAAALGGGDAGASLASLRDTVVSDLAAVALAAELSLADAASTSALLGDVMDRLDLQVADELGSMARALDRRKEGGERLPTLECLREWVALRVAYERHARVLGLGGRMAAFELVYHSLANQAAALWNKHGLRRLPNAMFAWMAAEAEAVGRSDAARTQAGNKSW